jgi:hypothetical protein
MDRLGSEVSQSLRQAQKAGSKLWQAYFICTETEAHLRSVQDQDTGSVWDGT